VNYVESLWITEPVFRRKTFSTEISTAALNNQQGFSQAKSQLSDLKPAS